MLSLPSTVRIFLCAAATDMRKGFDGLLGVCSQVFEEDPLSGHLFLFINRRRDRVKILFWDRDGLAIFYKRLERGTFEKPTIAADQKKIELDPAQLAMLLGGVDLSSARRKRYRRVG